MKDQRPARWRAEMQSKQLYIERKVLHPKDQKKFRESEKKIERESNHCKIDDRIFKQSFLLGQPEEGLD